MIDELRLQYPVPVLCELFDVSVSGYDAQQSRPMSTHARDEARLEMEIRAAHKRTRQTCGPESLQKDLAAHGVAVGVSRIKRIRTKLGIRCRQKRKFKATTDSGHTMPVADNVLKQDFSTTAPNQVWVTDLTYIPTEEGWLYLVGHKDLFTAEVVGYAMGARMTRDLFKASLLRAVWAKRPAAGLIHHSDRGSQYCSPQYRALLETHGMTASMSKKGDCYDNAPMESFWGILKTELVHHRRYRTREEAIREITEYIEVFYNRQRRQARLGYLSPAAFEMMYRQRSLAA
jgi:transposase InsO family protein